MDIHAFAIKYGIRGVGLMVERLLELAPDSRPKERLEPVVSEMVADLESALTLVLHK